MRILKYFKLHGDIMDRTHDEMRATIEKALNEKGESYVIASMIEGSIGYHTYDHAKRIIGDFKAGKTKCYCERAQALYDFDLLEMMDDDIRLMQRLEEINPTRVSNLVQYAEKTGNLSSEHQEVLGLMFPTM